MFKNTMHCTMVATALSATPVLAMGVEPGDEPTDPIVIGVNETVQFDTTNYTATGGFVSSSACSDTFLNWSPTSSNRDIWFSFTPETDGEHNFTTCWPGGYDTSMVIYQGGSNFTFQVACNGDGPADASCQLFHSEIDLEVTAGLTYLIRIGGYQADFGAAALTITGDPCAKSGEPTTIEVSNFAGLLDALDIACTDDVVLLAPGTYNVSSTIDLNAIGNRSFTIEGTVGKSGELLSILDGGNTRRIMLGAAPNLTLLNLAFKNGSANNPPNDAGGGAILAFAPGLGLIEGCLFEDNYAGVFGGAVCFNGPQSSMVNNCTFQNNSAGLAAGAIFHPQNSTTDPTSPTITNSRFLNNSAGGTGGAVAAGGSGPTYDNCLFDGNHTDADFTDFGGGAMHFNAGNTPTVTNCIISNNSIAGGQCGSAIWSGGATVTYYGNNTICGNTCNGSTNNQVTGNLVNLGGNTISSECVEPCPGDINGDSLVNAVDVGQVLGNWGCSGTCGNADVTGDGTVDAGDLAAVLGSWGACP